MQRAIYSERKKKFVCFLGDLFPQPNTILK
jgi:hypothetical protein